MIINSLSRTIKIIESIQQLEKNMDMKLDRELSYLVEHMKYVELMLMNDKSPH